MKKLPSFLQDAVIMNVGLFFAKGLLLLFRYIVIRQLTMADYGKYALLVSWFQVLIPFATFHTGHALAVTFSKQDESDQKIAWFNACIILLLIIAGIAMPFGVFDLFNILQSTNKLWMVIYYFGLLSVGMGVMFQGVFRGLFRPWLVASIEMSNALGRLVILFVLFNFLKVVTIETSLFAYLGGAIAGAFLGCLLLCFSSMVPSLDFSWKLGVAYIPKLLRFSGFIVLGDGITYLVQYISRFSLKSTGLESVAIYDATLLVYSVVQALFVGVGLAVVPYASKINNGLGLSFKWVIKHYLWLYIPIFAFILGALFTPWMSIFLDIIHLDEYKSALPLLCVQLLEAPIDLTYVTLMGVLFGSRKTKEYFFMVLLAAPVQIASYLILGSAFGGLGVAAAAVATKSCMVIVALWYFNLGRV